MSLRNFNVLKRGFSKRYFLLPIILIVFFLLFYLVYNDIKDKTINEFNNEQLIIAQAASQGITTFFQNYQNDLTFLSQNKGIIDFNDDTRALMEGFYNNHKNFIEAVTKVDAQGKIIYTFPYNKSVIGEDISYQKHVHQILTTHQPVISDVFMAVQGYLAVALHVPVFKGNEYKGSLAILIQIDKLGKLYFEKIKNRGTTHTWLLSENGIEIYCPIKGHIGKTILEITHNDSSSLGFMDKLKKESKGTAKNIHSEGSIDEQTQLIEKYIAFYRVPLGNTYWTILISFNEEEIYSTLNSFRNRLIIIFSFLFIVLAYYFYSFTKVRTVLKEETKRKEAEKTLHENEEIFRRFMEHSPIYVFFKDENIRSLRLSKNYESMLGKPVHELLGKNMFDLFPTELAKSMVEDDKRILNEGKEITVEEELNGRFYSTIKFPIFIDGTPRYLAGYTIDITERKRSDEALRQAKLVVENSPAVLFRWRAEEGWPVTFVSQNVAQFGYIQEELLNGSTPYASIVHPEDLKRITQEVESNTKLGLERFQQEYRILRKDGTTCWVDDRTLVESNKEGQVTHYQGIVVDITERKLAEKALRESENKFRSVIEEAVEIVFTVDNQGYFTYVNPAGIKSSGYSLDELKKLKYVDLIEADHKHRVKSHYLNQYKERKVVSTIEYPFRSMSGEIKWFNQNARLIIENEKVQGFYVIARDVTDRRKAEEALQERETRYRTLFNLSPSGIVLIDTDGKIIDANESFCKSVLYTRDELIDRSILLVVPEQRHSDVKDHIQKIQSGIVLEHVVTNVKKDGTLCEMELRESLILLSDGRKGILTIANDITERKRAEEALRESEEKYRLIVENSHEGIEISQDEIIIYANNQFAEMLGYTVAELKEMKFNQIFTEQGISELNERGRKRSAGELENSHQYETTFIKKDRTIIHVSVNYEIIEYNNRPATFATIQDITERKLSEQILHQSEERFRTLYENATIGLYRTNPEGKIILANPALIAMLGFRSFEELSKRDLSNAGFEPNYSRNTFIDLIEKQGEIKGLEASWKHVDGSTIFVKESAKAIKDSDGKTLFYDGTVEDVTERKFAQQAMQESEAKLQVIVESTADGILAVDENGKIIKTNNRFAELWGIPPNILNSGDDNDLLNFVLDQLIDPEQFLSKVRRLYNSADEDFDTVFFKDGRTFERYSAPLSVSGKIIGRVWSFRDITERKKAEILIYEEQNLMTAIINSLPGIVYLFDMQGKFLRWNKNFEIVSGYSHAEISNLHPSDLFGGVEKDLVQQRIQDVFINGEANVEAHFTTKNGVGIPYFLTGARIEIKGEPNLIGMGLDITERKQIVEALRESENKFRSVIEEAVEIVFTIDNQGYFTYVNPAGIKSSGYTLDELKKLKYIDLVEPNYKQKAKHNYFRQFIERRALSTEDYPFCTKSGEIKWFNQNVRLIIENDEVKGFYVISRDITERREAEEALRESEEKFRSLVESINEVFYIADKDGKITYCSPNITPATGFRQKEILGNSFLKLIAPVDRRLVLDHYLGLTSKGGSDTMQVFRVRCKDGTIVWAEQMTHLVRDEYGDVLEYRNVTRNITDRKKAEEELKKLSRAVEQSPVSVIITNRDGDIEYVNEKFCEVTGYAKEEVLDKNPRILNSGYHSKDLYLELWNTILEGENWQGEMRNKKKNGELYWESVLISPIVNQEGKITNFVAVKEDITEKKMILEELIEAKEKAEQSNKLKDAFIANMSHEIRTPLNGILGLSSIVKTLYAEHVKGDEESIFSGIEHSSKRIIRTVDMILNYSRVQTGEFPVNPMQINLSLISENLVKEFTITAKNKSIDLSFENRCGDVISIFGDEYSVTQAISNLIDNAIKYTEEGFIKVILYAGTNDEILLDITDSGIGISEEYLSRIFQPYQQEHIGYGRAYEGIGLGLSMVKKFLNLNKADIFVKSEKEKGSTFTINFGRASQSETNTENKKTDKIISEQVTHKKPLVLIVEDDVFNQTTIKFFIESKYKTIVSDSSEGAIELMKNNKVDIVLMDISIKGNKNGLELTKEFKESKEYSKIPVIAITAHAFEIDRHNAFEAGCDDYLSKPFSKALLLETIDKYF